MMESAPPLVNPAEIARGVEATEMIFRRWLGAWIDFAVLAAIILGPIFIAPQNMGQAALVVALVGGLGYFPLTEGRWGRSLGKLVSGTIVLDKEGRPPGFGRAVVRTLFRLIEVNPFFAGGIIAGLCVAFSRNHQRMGDMAADTFVIPVNRLRAKASVPVVETFT